MPNSLQELRDNFRGYRSNRFKIKAQLPPLLGESRDSTIEFYVKAAQVPGAAVGFVPLNYRGRNVKFPAERSFNDWGIQVYPSADTNQDLRRIFVNWIQILNSGKHDIMNYELVSPQWEILFNDINGSQSIPNGYKNRVVIYNCFPIDISPMEMNNEVPDQFAEFTLTMAYDYTEELDVRSTGSSSVSGNNFTIA